MRSDNIEAQLKDLEEILAPLNKKRLMLNNQLRSALSVEFIYINNIKKDDVESASGDGIPWFGHISEFGEWLKINSTKQYCSWDGRIYVASEIIAGRMESDAVGRVEDLEG